jgi:tetratricopeptide (TPR) repeat protein
MTRDRKRVATSIGHSITVLFVAWSAASCGGAPGGERGSRTRLAELMARQLAPHVVAHDLRAAAAAATSALVQPQVAWVIVQDADGQAMAAAERPGVDDQALRTALALRAWRPAGATWTTTRDVAPWPAETVSLPIVAGEDAPGGRHVVGTLHVGFRPAGFLMPAHAVERRIRRMAAGWTPPFNQDLTTRSRQARLYYADGVRAVRKFYETEARTAWLMAIEEDPQFAMALVRLGRLAHDLGDEDAARAWHGRAADEAGRVTDRERLEIELLGAELDDREVDERAIEAELIRRFSDDVDVLVVAANQHLTEGRPGMAMADLHKAIRLDPDRTDAWNLLGYAHTELGHWAEAEEAFEKYVFVHEEQANPHDSLGEFYLRRGQYHKALAQFETATEIKPDFGWAHYHLALVNAELGRWEASLFAIQHARDIARQLPEERLWSRAQIALHLRAGRVAEAVALGEAHRAGHALTAADEALLGRVALAAGDAATAHAQLDALLAALARCSRSKGCDLTELDNYFLFPELQGLLLYAEGRPGDAVEPLDKALAAARAWEARQRIEREIVAALIDSGRRDEAVRRLEVTLARNAEDPSANWALGRILEREGRPGEARAALERVCRALDGADEDDPLTVAVREAWRATGG